MAAIKGLSTGLMNLKYGKNLRIELAERTENAGGQCTSRSQVLKLRGHGPEARPVYSLRYAGLRADTVDSAFASDHGTKE